MNTTALPAAPGKLAAPSRWAVETHGLTKRFRANIAANGVELLALAGPRSATSAQTAPARPRSSGCCWD
jgi:hypothetical protein